MSALWGWMRTQPLMPQASWMRPNSTASAGKADAVELGRIQDAWGIKGWVRIQPHSADTDALFASQDWFLQPPEARFARGFRLSRAA